MILHSDRQQWKPSECSFSCGEVSHKDSAQALATAFEENGALNEVELNRGPSAYQVNTLQRGQTSSQ